jgi:hypothetical protein
MGVGGCLVSLLMIIGSGGISLIPSLLLLLFSIYFICHTYINSATVKYPFLELTTTRLFRTSTKHVPLASLTTRCRAAGSLRSSKHYVLEIYYQHKLLAQLSPKEGFTSQELERLAATLALHSTSSTDKGSV